MPITGQFITEPARSIPVHGEYEVVVLGGGPAGIAAAASAAAQGRKTILVERYGFLGGAGTASGVTTFCGLFANVHGDIRKIVHGVADDLLARIDRLGGLNAPHLVLGKTKGLAYDTTAYKAAADDLLMGRGVDLFFHAFGVGVLSEADGPTALIVETKSGRRAIRGRMFIDCSGDGDLAAWAGAPFELGDAAGNLMYPTMMFRVNGVDPALAGEAWTTIPELMRQAEKRGTRFARQGVIVRPQRNPVEWRVNATQVSSRNGRALDGTDADELSYGEIEGRQQAQTFMTFLRSSVPGFAQAYIVDTPPQLGIRETRRIVGSYQLSGEDVLNCASFEDVIGVNAWPLEQHVAGNVEWSWPPIPQSRGFNHLPYRMMLPQRPGNLLVAGRCASMTREGHSAARVSGGCFVMGEAAGAAAHLALAGNTTVAEVDVAKLQGLLEAQGAYLGRDVT
jgi:FAD-dependent oxidoreductase family protein